MKTKQFSKSEEPRIHTVQELKHQNSFAKGWRFFLDEVKAKYSDGFQTFLWHENLEIYCAISWAYPKKKNIATSGDYVYYFCETVYLNMFT